MSFYTARVKLCRHRTLVWQHILGSGLRVDRRAHPQCSEILLSGISMLLRTTEDPGPPYGRDVCLKYFRSGGG